MGKASPPTRAGSLSRVIRALTTFIFPRNPESDTCVQVFILYPTHKQTACEMKTKMLVKTTFVVCMELRLASPPRRASQPLKCSYMENFQPSGEILVVNSEISSPALLISTKTNFDKEFN